MTDFKGYILIVLLLVSYAVGQSLFIENERALIVDFDSYSVLEAHSPAQAVSSREAELLVQPSFSPVSGCHASSISSDCVLECGGTPAVVLPTLIANHDRLLMSVFVQGEPRTPANRVLDPPFRPPIVELS